MAGKLEVGKQLRNMHWKNFFYSFQLYDYLIFNYHIQPETCIEPDFIIYNG